MSVWTEEKTTELLSAVGTARPVSQETLAVVAEQLDVSPRSVGAKLRKLGEEVELAGAKARAFSDAEEAQIRKFVEANSGKFTYADIAAQVCNGKFSAKQVQGKILSLELTGAVAPTPKAETARSYSESEENTIEKLINSGAFLEDIAAAVNRPLNSVRGKCLSMMRTHGTPAVQQREKRSADKVDPLEALGDVSEMTVSEIAKRLEKTERGIKTMLTHRGTDCADYKAKKRKAAA